MTHPPWNRAAFARGGVAAGLAPAWVEGLRLLGPTGTLTVLVEAAADTEAELATAGWRPVLTQEIRLAGRVCRVVVAVPSEGPERDPVSATLRSWRQRAMNDGLVTKSGF
ncbi:MAG: hypothetical protein ACR2MN_01065 [Acidimicrobiales bacterium]